MSKGNPRGSKSLKQELNNLASFRICWKWGIWWYRHLWGTTGSEQQGDCEWVAPTGKPCTRNLPIYRPLCNFSLEHLDFPAFHALARKGMEPVSKSWLNVDLGLKQFLWAMVNIRHHGRSILQTTTCFTITSLRCTIKRWLTSSIHHNGNVLVENREWRPQICCQ